MCLCYLTEPSPILSQLIKPTELMKELKIDFWCFSSTGFRGSFYWTCPWSRKNQEKSSAQETPTYHHWYAKGACVKPMREKVKTMFNRWGWTSCWKVICKIDAKDDADMSWIFCESCACWFHTYCVGLADLTE